MGDVGIELMDWCWGMAGAIFKDEYVPTVWCTTRASRHSAGGACWHLGDYKKKCVSKERWKASRKELKRKSDKTPTDVWLFFPLT